MNICSRNMIIY